jgi:exodeoxyribonuclease V alpha subunit
MPELQSCKCELTESSRFPEFNPDGTPGEIFTLSEAVKAGQADKVLAQLKQGTGKLVHYLELDNRQRPSLWPNFQATVENLFAEFQQQTTPEGALLAVKGANGRETRSAPLNDCRLLCAFRHGPFGVEAINKYLRKLLGDRCPLPMMITRNEQSLDVSNGDVGVIMPDEPGYLYLPKPDNTVRRIPVELLPDMELAFASTVHKSQGSEFDNVIIVLPPTLDGGDGEALLTREILYTAITRTKKQLFIYAGDKTLRQCCENVIHRQTALLR